MPAARASTSSRQSSSTGSKGAKKAPAKKASATKKSTKKTPAKTTAKKASATKKSTKKAPAKKAAAATKEPAVKKPKLPKFLTDRDWLKKQQAALIEERKSYTHSAESLAAEAAALMADREPGDVQFDEESGEGDTLAVERDRDLALSAKAREKVDEIDAALARLDEGTYGICTAGSDVIPKERLEALPMAAKCVTHQTAMF